ncbi:MAG: hypothetical protein AB4290_26040 [Spirulina sp.]
MMTPLPLKLERLPGNFPKESMVSIDLVEGIPIFRASEQVQSRIESLLTKYKESNLSDRETEELDSYEELDDYLSWINRTIRNLYLTQS